MHYTRLLFPLCLINLVLVCFPYLTFAQSVGIGTATPDISAKLDIYSTNRGLLVPRISLADANIFGLVGNSNTQGMLIYNTNAAILNGNGIGFYFWNGSAWKQLQIYSTPVTETDPQVSSTTPNYVPKWNGTTLTDGLIFDNGTNIGIGISSPTAKLEVNGKIKTTTLQATNGAVNGYVLQSDATGNGTWVNSTTLPITELDPKVATTTTNKIAKWNGTQLVNSVITDNGNVGINSPLPVTAFQVAMGNHTLAISQTSVSNWINATTPNYQTFTATSTATLSKIELGFNANSNQTVTHTLRIYSGVGTTGTLLYTHTPTTVNIPTAPTWAEYILSDAVALQAGNVYTIALDNQSRWAYNTTNPYAGGQSSLNVGSDYSFKIYTQADGFHITNTNKVGIGTSTPSYLLSLTGESHNTIGMERILGGNDGKDLAIVAGGATSGAFDKAGGDLILSGGTATGNGNALGSSQIIFKTATPLGSSSNTDQLPTEKMRITADGNIGIGTSTVNQAKVVINGFQTNYLTYGYLNSSGNTGGNISSTNSYSLYASHRIAASEFNAFSDARIKKIIGLSDNTQDATTLAKIRITDYTFIDTIGKGKTSYKKVIAQELRKIYPQAVNLHQEVIPNIYQLSYIKAGFVPITHLSEVNIGDKIKLIFEEEEQLVEVINIDTKGLYLNTIKEGQVFVYGKEVKDFHTVDYEALTTLNISATQKLLSQVSSLNEELIELRKEIQLIKGIVSSKNLVITH